MSILNQTKLLTLYRDAFDALWRDDPVGLMELNGLIAKAEEGIGDAVQQGILKTVVNSVQRERKACAYCGGRIHDVQSGSETQKSLI